MSVTITSFSPTSGPIGTIITVNGSDFNPAGPSPSVWIGGGAVSYGLVTFNQMQVNVTAGAVTGNISISNADGTATSAGVFTVIPSVVDVGGAGPMTTTPRARGPYYAVTSLPTNPETWWVVTDGADQPTVFNQAQGILQARFSTVPQQFQSPEYLDEQKDLIVCTKAVATGKVGAAGMQEYERLNPVG